jgi:hypothetical protein
MEMTDLAFLNKMKARFPTLYPESDHALAVDCPPGWERLLWEFCENLEAFKQKTGADVWVSGCKEKYARLLVYVHGDDSRPPRRPQKCSCGTKLNLVCKFCSECGAPVETAGDALGYTVRDMVQGVEDKSCETCQVCGRPGFGYDVNGWDYTLCPEHYTRKEFGHDTLFYEATDLLREIPDDGDHLQMADWRKRAEAFLAKVEEHDRRWIPGHGPIEEG